MKHRKHQAALLAGLMLALCAAVPVQAGPKKAAPAAAAPKAAEPSAEQKAPAGEEKAEIMARVGSEDITVPDFLRYMMKDTRMLDISRTDSGRAQILNEMILEKLTREAVIREGLLLNSQGPRMGAFRLAEQELMRKHYPKPPVPTETEILEYYNAHIDELGIPEKVRVIQIQVRTPANATEAEKQAARGKLQAALARIQQGEEFAKVAAEVTENAQLKDKGGDAGFIPANVSPWFKQATASLKPGEYTEVLESPVGYEILKITDRREGMTPSYGEAREKIIETIRAQAQIKARKAYLHGVAKQVGVQILMPELAAAAP